MAMDLGVFAFLIVWVPPIFLLVFMANLPSKILDMFYKIKEWRSVDKTEEEKLEIFRRSEDRLAKKQERKKKYSLLYKFGSIFGSIIFLTIWIILSALWIYFLLMVFD